MRGSGMHAGVHGPQSLTGVHGQVTAAIRPTDSYTLAEGDTRFDGLSR